MDQTLNEIRVTAQGHLGAKDLAEHLNELPARQDAIKAGGSSLRDYVQTSGELGYFQHQWRVYGKEGEPCPDCPGAACKLVQRIMQSGRSSFFCPLKQK